MRHASSLKSRRRLLLLLLLLFYTVRILKAFLFLKEKKLLCRGAKQSKANGQSRDSDVINFAKSKTLMDHPFSFSNSFVTGRWRSGTAAQVRDINWTTADTI